DVEPIRPPSGIGRSEGDVVAGGAQVAEGQRRQRGAADQGAGDGAGVGGGTWRVDQGAAGGWGGGGVVGQGDICRRAGVEEGLGGGGRGLEEERNEELHRVDRRGVGRVVKLAAPRVWHAEDDAGHGRDGRQRVVRVISDGLRSGRFQFDVVAEPVGAGRRRAA